MDKLSVTEQKIVLAKAKGLKNSQIAPIVYPDQTPQAGAVSVNRVLKKANVQQALAPIYKKLGITIEKSLAPVAKALEAKIDHYQTVKIVTGKGKDRTVEYREELVRSEDNLPMQLQGSDRALKLLGVYGQVDKDNSIADYTASELAALASASDEVELTKLVFKKL